MPYHGRDEYPRLGTLEMKESTKLIIVVLVGCLFGVFIFLPVDELTSYYEYGYQTTHTLRGFVAQQMTKALLLQTPGKLFLYLALGGIVGAISYLLISLLNRRNSLIVQLERELRKDLDALIRRGEDDSLEFKSSFRYDYRLQKVNKALKQLS